MEGWSKEQDTIDSQQISLIIREYLLYWDDCRFESQFGCCTKVFPFLLHYVAHQTLGWNLIVR